MGLYVISNRRYPEIDRAGWTHFDFLAIRRCHETTHHTRATLCWTPLAPGITLLHVTGISVEEVRVQA